MDTETKLNPAQEEVVSRGLLASGFSCVLQLPTGAGKTWLAEKAIGAVLQAGGRAIYLTPLRALASELLEQWRSTFSDHQVGVFTGEYGPKRPYPVPFEQARLLIMTPERLDACTRHWRSHWSWIPEVDLVVVDEFHLLGDPVRGPRLEGALCRTRRLNPFAQFLGLSATMGNGQDLADWLGGVYYRSDWRPLPIEWRITSFKKATDKPSLLEHEVRRCVEARGQSLVFVQSRRRAEQLSAYLGDVGLAAAHHHAGLQSEARQEVEGQFRNRKIDVLVATGTLEMGLNLPARQVVLYDLQGFDGRDFVPLAVNTVWQRGGRAGRRGLDDHGEVVLLAPSWDRSAAHYLKGNFESIRSSLGDTSALAEQVLAEVASGLSRTRTQLQRSLQLSLAHHQSNLAHTDQVLNKMLAADMLVEGLNEAETSLRLKATRLGRIAVRQMLSPETVLRLAKTLKRDDVASLTLLDWLLLCADTPDCEPFIPADFEELETLGELVALEHSTLLSGSATEIRGQFECSGRRLLTCIKTALVARSWTRTGDTEEVAEQFSCYPFEVRRLAESLERILTAATAAATPPKDQTNDPEDTEPHPVDGEATTLQRVRALTAMVSQGIDEEAVTLTLIPGIGGTLARRLQAIGVNHVEDLCQAEPEDLADMKGLSATRARNWINSATEFIRTHSALTFREYGDTVETTSLDWPSTVDPYRFRRAIDLVVKANRRNHYTVSGGLEPHMITARTGEAPLCDCADFGRGSQCKHVLAVRLHRKDPQLSELRDQFAQEPNAGSGLNLFDLWFDRN